MKAAKIPPVLCALLSACSRTPPPPPAAAPPPAPAVAPAPASALALSIVPSEDYPQPDDHGERVLYNGQIFYVVLANHSETPVTISEEWNSQGWYQLSFTATLSDGTVVDLKKGRRSWTRNFSSTITIPPGGYYVFPEHFDAKIWPDLPLLFQSKGITLKAVFEEKKALQGAPSVWAGRVESPPESFAIGN